MINGDKNNDSDNVVNETSEVKNIDYDASKPKYDGTYTVTRDESELIKDIQTKMGINITSKLDNDTIIALEIRYGIPINLNIDTNILIKRINYEYDN